MALPSQFYVTGTDTDVGKTVVSALLCKALGAAYWKPVQAGLETETDSQRVGRLARCTVYPEGYRLIRPASPHAAAQDENLRVDIDQLKLPTDDPLVVEGAGGLMVPFAAAPVRWQHELMQALRLPVLVVARTGLGTLNHSFLTHHALQSHGLSCLGYILVGPPHAENERDIARYTGTPVRARIDWRDDVEADFDSLAMQLARDLENQP